ncbi:MAG: ATP-dependent RNA helicase HrpA [Deltaproteobacteria bacterium]
MSSPSVPALPPAASGLRLVFPPELPISARVPDIAAAIRAHPVVIVAGATGSGKTTQLPKVALELGRGRERRIGVTQPRRIAATSVAARVASELGCPLGAEVGYKIRFEQRIGQRTRVEFMTDGILLAEIQGDELLRRYDTLIIDEAHERSLTIDFLLGWLARILPKRPDLKVLISSATIETQRFSEFFGGAPVIQVEGRTYPVEVLYEPPDPELDLSDAVARAVESLGDLDARGDILVFLPGEREIREAEQALLARELRHTRVQPLYARLSAADQNRVFSRISERRVILATNVAETSLTIPGIVYVVDTGVARLSRYDSATGTTRLQIEEISRASADQRKGRCGRVREGLCVRLYDEIGFATRPEFTDPEILRTGLAGVILRMKALRLGAVEEFRFLDPPLPRAINEGYRVLEELGALDAERALTPLGWRLAQFPVDPRIGRMILAGAERGCLEPVLVLAAALGIQDPRERPRGAEHKADDLHRRFRDERSDFVGLTRLWAFVSEAAHKGSSALRRTCQANYLSFARVREWIEVRRQLADVVSELDLGGAGKTEARGEGPRRGRRRRVAGRRDGGGTAERGAPGKIAERSPPAPNRAPPAARAAAASQDPSGSGQGEADFGEAVHRALLSGLLSRIGRYDAEQRSYLGARQTRFAIHPGSALAKKPPQWLMAFELVQTTRLFARTVAKIEPEWLDEVGGQLLKRSYSDPHWSEKSARAMIKEHATLYGLPVFRDRRVDYARIEPARARLLFLEHALVRGEFESRGAFQASNRQLLAEVARLREKARQSEMFVDDEALVDFFERRVPESVSNGKAFEVWREAAERTDPHVLSLSLSDVLPAGSPISPESYPDVLRLHGVDLPLSYRFEPSAADDGITVDLPLALLPQLDPGELEWTIPAWQLDKLTALLGGLPKAVLRDQGPAAALADALTAQLAPFTEPLLPALSRALFQATGVTVEPSAFRLDRLPTFLRFSFRVLGERGSVLAQGRDLALLIEQQVPNARAALRQSARQEWGKQGLVRWDFADLPEFVTEEVLGTPVRRYPALVDRQSSVDLGLLESAAAAQAATRRGVERLLYLAVHKPLLALAKRAPPPLSRAGGLPVARAEADAFRERVLGRAVREAFGLEQAPLPRTRADFDALYATGAPRLEAAFERLARAFGSAAAELAQTERALAASASEPSGTQAARDIRAQLAELFPPDLLESIAIDRLEQFPRYLRAAQLRLGRAILEPRRDADKLEGFALVWKTFLDKRGQARDPAALLALRWRFEELRVAIFAPELEPLRGVSMASVARAVEAL